jgi:dihydroorotase
MPKLLLQHGRVLDPSQKLDSNLNILLNEGRIVDLGPNLKSEGADILNASGLVIAPGFIDMHVHFREPGKEEAETISTGSLSAAAGGFTAVACMPNTQPVNDNVATTELIRKQSAHAPVAVLPIAAITKNEEGVELTPMSALKAAGAVGFSDDGKPVASAQMMRSAMETARELGLPIIDHCEDPTLSHGAAMHEGKVSRQLGWRGMPSAAEEIMVARNIILAQLTGAHIHLAHMSTAGSMHLIRQAKKIGVKVSCEVTPHHFTLTDEAIAEYGTNAKMNPPLRTSTDLEEVLQAIQDGTVDVVASDHAPHHVNTKTVELNVASFGIIGLETSVSLGLDRLVNRGLISLSRFVELYSTGAAKILNLERNIQKGAEANLTIFHPTKTIAVDASKFHTKSRNTPFHGWNLQGAPMATIYKGKLVWKHPSLS